MRRLIIEEPVAGAAVWSRRSAVFALAVAAMSVALARLAPAEAEAALSVLAAALIIALAAILLGGAALAVIWQTGRRGTGQALGAIALALALLAAPVWLAVAALRLPAINDISTDRADPPQFSRSARALAARANRVPPAASPEAAAAQERGYPFVQPIVLDIEAADAYALVQRAVAARGWQILERVSPGGRAGIGHIEAVDRSILFGFPDDITIRLRPLGGQTRIDIRSASRFGQIDFGANARRIARFAEEVQAQLEVK